ncbi:MAG TPA: lysophospholipid acyltransferase family protein [Candidatus Obscuribacterales bacterium]
MQLSPASAISPLALSQQLLSTLGTRVTYHHRAALPSGAGLMVVSNHRSILDVPLVMMASRRPVRFACHHYMSRVPVLNEIVTGFGCLPLGAADDHQRSFFQQAVHLLKAQQAIGIFPEGAQPMVELTPPDETRTFHRGFAHLALRAPVENLAILPIAIASQQELTHSVFPLQLLSWFDPSEPLFNQAGWHPLVIYQQVDVVVGQPIWITPQHRQAYQGRQARSMVTELTSQCQAEIDRMLRHGG